MFTLLQSATLSSVKREENSLEKVALTTRSTPFVFTKLAKDITTIHHSSLTLKIWGMLMLYINLRCPA